MNDVPSPIHEAECEEYRDAVDSLTEAERVSACRHYFKKRICVYCGDTADEEG